MGLGYELDAIAGDGECAAPSKYPKKDPRHQGSNRPLALFWSPALQQDRIGSEAASEVGIGLFQKKNALGFDSSAFDKACAMMTLGKSLR